MIEEQEVMRRGRRRTPAEIQQIVSEFKSGQLTKAFQSEVESNGMPARR
jgi:hypothetical protein